jgi:hypothetical protein
MKQPGKNEALNADTPKSGGPADWLEEIALRRWSEAEMAAQRRLLGGKPAELRRFEEEAALNEVLDARPGAPVAASNFSTRVRERIELEAKADRRARAERSGRGIWPAWLRPAFALAALCGSLGIGWNSFQAYHRHHAELIARGASTLAFSASSPELSGESLENYDVIRRLGSNPEPDDEALIAALVEGSAR